jgi:Tol biopolymer transport system component
MLFRLRRLWPTITAAMAVMLAITACKPREHSPEAHKASGRLQVPLPENVRSARFPSVSPDGHWLVVNVAFEPEEGLWIYDLRTAKWRKLPGTEDSRSPFWSPDSRFLGFATGKLGRESQLKKIEVGGGSPQTLFISPEWVYGGSWSREGVILFATANGPIHQVSAAGGIPIDVTYLNRRREFAHSGPAFLPDGKHFLYSRSSNQGASGIYVGSLDAKPEEQSQEPVLLNPSLDFQYADGHLFFMSEVPGLLREESILIAQPFDADDLQLRGQPAVVAEHVMTVSGDPSVSPSGSLAYFSNSIRVYQPTWFDRHGGVIGTFGEPRPDEGVAVSPDGIQATVQDASVPPTLSSEIWLLDTARGGRRRLTSREGGASFPVWSPDGTRLIFAAGKDFDTLYEKAASGAGDEKVLLKSPGEKHPTSWSRDGRFLLYHISAPKTGDDLWALPLEGPEGVPARPVRLLATEDGESEGSFSPDGHWVAYTHSKWPRSEVYVKPFIALSNSQPRLGAATWKVALDGVRPVWSSDGKEIIFRTPHPDVSPRAVEVSANGTDFQVVGFRHGLFTPPPNNGWDVTADGQRFLTLVSPAGQNRHAPVTVVFNWQTALRH